MNRPIVIVEGGIVQDVLDGQTRPDYIVWDWDNFRDDPARYWYERAEEERACILATFHPSVIRELQEMLAEDMAWAIEQEKREREADPFWMVEAR